MDQQQQMLEKLNDTLEKVLEKIDKQGQSLAGLDVKVDLYRETQLDQNRKIEALEQKVTEAVEGAKSAHKRADELQTQTKGLQDQLKQMNDDKANDNKWTKRFVLGGFLTIVTGVVTAILIAHWGLPPVTTK